MSNLIHFIRAGGLVMYPLIVLSVAAVGVIVERALAYRQLGNLAPGLLPSVLNLSREGRSDEALKLCQERQGPIAACLTIILRHRDYPTEETERMVEETGQEYFIRLEQYLPVLDTTTTVSPLLGLLGTIVGMVGTFNAIAGHQGTGNNDAILSGVGEALYATATGIGIAVVCFISYNYFAARLRTVTAETEQAATKLLNVLAERHHAETVTAVPLANSIGGRTHGEEQNLGVQTSARA